MEPSASDVDGWDDDGADDSVEVAESDAEVLEAEDAVSDALETLSEGEADSDEREVLDAPAEADPDIEIEAVAEIDSADPANKVELAGSTA